MNFLKLTHSTFVYIDKITSVKFKVFSSDTTLDVKFIVEIAQDNGLSLDFVIPILTSKQVKDRFGFDRLSYCNEPGVRPGPYFYSLDTEYDVSIFINIAQRVLTGEITLQKDQSLAEYLIYIMENDEEVIKAVNVMSELRNSCLRLFTQEDIDMEARKSEMYKRITDCSSPEELEELNKFLKEVGEETIPDMETLAETQRHLIGPRQELTAPAENWLRKNKNSSDGKDEKEEILFLNSKSSCGMPTGLQIFIIMVLIFLAIYMVVK